ncbi:IS256 family transposase, partial [Corynebacterium variabile]
ALLESGVPTAAKELTTHNRRRHLFNYLEVPARLPAGDTPPPVFKPTTNMLEGGINAMIKNLARAHRGLTGEHQRTVIDW